MIGSLVVSVPWASPLHPVNVYKVEPSVTDELEIVAWVVVPASYKPVPVVAP